MYCFSCFIFLCLILAVYACGLSLSFLPRVFFSFFPLTLLCLPAHVFVFFPLLSQGLSRLFNTTTFIHFFSAAPDCYRLFLHFAVMFLFLYFFRKICRTVCTYPSPGHYSRGTGERRGGRLDSGALL